MAALIAAVLAPSRASAQDAPPQFDPALRFVPANSDVVVHIGIDALRKEGQLSQQIRNFVGKVENFDTTISKVDALVFAVNSPDNFQNPSLTRLGIIARGNSPLDFFENDLIQNNASKTYVDGREFYSQRQRNKTEYTSFSPDKKFGITSDSTNEIFKMINSFNSENFTSIGLRPGAGFSAKPILYAYASQKSVAKILTEGKAEFQRQALAAPGSGIGLQLLAVFEKAQTVQLAVWEEGQNFGIGLRIATPSPADAGVMKGSLETMLSLAGQMNPAVGAALQNLSGEIAPDGNDCTIRVYVNKFIFYQALNMAVAGARAEMQRQGQGLGPSPF